MSGTGEDERKKMARELALSHIGRFPGTFYIENHYQPQVILVEGNYHIFSKSVMGKNAGHIFKEAVEACMKAGNAVLESESRTYVYGIGQPNGIEEGEPWLQDYLVGQIGEGAPGYIYVHEVVCPKVAFPNTATKDIIACVVGVVEGYRYLGCGYSSLEWNEGEGGAGAGVSAGSGRADAYEDETDAFSDAGSDIFAVTEAPTVLSRYVFATE